MRTVSRYAASGAKAKNRSHRLAQQALHFLLVTFFVRQSQCWTVCTIPSSSSSWQGRRRDTTTPPLLLRNLSVGHSNHDDDDSTRKNRDKNAVGKEVQELLARAKAIRDSLPQDEGNTGVATSATSTDETQQQQQYPSVGYRLYIDIGREDGTWMDPKWGASGSRIELTMDVSFRIPDDGGGDKDDDSLVTSDLDVSLATEEIAAKMVKDNLSGQSTAVRVLDSSPNARLRGGFDQMQCLGGGYRVDIGRNQRGSSTARFFVQVEGTKESEYGDINIPQGCLYFSIPCFNSSVKQLSSKEGIVTVRQMGWHTGWRRDESRIVGTFRAAPIDKAKQKDGF